MAGYRKRALCIGAAVAFAVFAAGNNQSSPTTSARIVPHFKDLDAGTFNGKKIDRKLADSLSGKSNTSFQDCAFTINSDLSVSRIRKRGLTKELVHDCVMIGYRNGQRDVLEMVSAFPCRSSSSGTCRSGFELYLRKVTRVERTESSAALQSDVITTTRVQSLAKLHPSKSYVGQGKQSISKLGSNPRVGSKAVPSFDRISQKIGNWDAVARRIDSMEFTQTKQTHQVTYASPLTNSAIWQSEIDETPIFTARNSGNAGCPYAGIAAAGLTRYGAIAIGTGTYSVAAILAAPETGGASLAAAAGAAPEAGAFLTVSAWTLGGLAGKLTTDACNYLTGSPPPPPGSAPVVPPGKVPPPSTIAGVPANQCVVCTMPASYDGYSTITIEAGEEVINVFAGSGVICLPGGWEAEPNGVDNDGDGQCDQ